MSDDLGDLVRYLGTVPRYSQRFVHAALGKTALGMKTGWRGIASAYSRAGRLRGFPASIDYEVTGDFPTYEAEIGPNVGAGQGSLGIIEDAGGGVTAPAMKARPKLLKSGEADFEKGLDNAVADALKRAGLG